jgi:anti-sigma B factor antagonist
MELRFEESAGALVVTALGARLDAMEAPDFRARVGEQAQGRRLLVLDASAISFVDSSGLAAIISVHKRLAPGGVLRLVGASDAVKTLLRITRLEKVFPSYPDVAGALGR